MNRTIKNGLIMLIKILFDTNFKRAEEKRKTIRLKRKLTNIVKQNIRAKNKFNQRLK